MRTDILLMASAASAFPFMSPGLDKEKRMEDLTKRTEQTRTAGQELGRRAIIAANNQKRDLVTGLLGGGLIGGVLQPLSGILADLDIPTPQGFGLKEIPGDDPDHQFIAPQASDVRGLCPSLNTLANYGYISRDGITSFAEAANAAQTAWGFGYDLSTFLSALGLIAGGDLLSGKYSIGGADARVPNSLGPALGIAKHGTFEIDGSISRQDNYFGDQSNFIPSRWHTIRKQAETAGSGYFNEDMWIANQKYNYENSKNTNPEFNGGAKYLAVSLAERAFMYRAFPNGTTPEVADAANIEPFWLANEFPEHWFRRNDPYGLPELALDLVNLYAGYPFLPGVNDGLDNFIPLDDDISTKTPNQLMCFILTNIFDTVPGQVQPLLAENIDTFAGLISGVVSPFFGNFECEAVNSFSAPGQSCATADKKCTDPAGDATNPFDNTGMLADTPAPGKPLTNQY